MTKGLLLKVRICSYGSKFLPLRIDPTVMGQRPGFEINRRK